MRADIAMKTDGPDVAIDRRPREDERRPHQDELPELAFRVLSDFERIIAAEARLLESNIMAAAQNFLGRVYLASTLIVLRATGVVALLASLMLLLHRWMPWWQVLAIVGAVAIAAAEILRRSLIPVSASQSSASSAH
jgi:hypothetical protein